MDGGEEGAIPAKKATETAPAQAGRGRGAPPRVQRSALTGLPVVGTHAAPTCICPLLPLVFIAIIFFLDVVSR